MSGVTIKMSVSVVVFKLSITRSLLPAPAAVSTSTPESPAMSRLPPMSAWVSKLPVSMNCIDLPSKFPLGRPPIAERLPVQKYSRREEDAPALRQLEPLGGGEVDSLNVERILGLEARQQFLGLVAQHALLL